MAPIVNRVGAPTAPAGSSSTVGSRSPVGSADSTARGRGDVTVTIGADGSAMLSAIGLLRLPR
jgi:hypothetical protein